MTYRKSNRAATIPARDADFESHCLKLKPQPIAVATNGLQKYSGWKRAEAPASGETGKRKRLTARINVQAKEMRDMIAFLKSNGRPIPQLEEALQAIADLMAEVDGGERWQSTFTEWIQKTHPAFQSEEIGAIITAATCNRTDDLKTVRSNADLGKLIGLTFADRARHGLKQLVPCDVSPGELDAARKERRRVKHQARQAAVRRKKGMRPRADLIAESVSEEARREGVCRATIRRKRKAAADAKNVPPVSARKEKKEYSLRTQLAHPPLERQRAASGGLLHQRTLANLQNGRMQ